MIWDEPAGTTPRGTLVLLPGRGETPASYRRFGRRLAADAYRVRFVETDLGNLGPARARVEKLLADETLPAPKVLVGADSGAMFAGTLVDGSAADAAVIAGIALPGSATPVSWEQELSARTACPVHRQVLAEDECFGRGGLAVPVPWSDGDRIAPAKPALVLHGTADPITAPAEVLAAYGSAARTRIRLVNGGRHDILNDVSHRSVAATIVLFLESLRLAPTVPDIVAPALAGAGTS